VVVQDITLGSKEVFGLKIDHGSLVKEVLDKSPAFHAGIKSGDVIIEFDRFPIKNSIELPKRVVHSNPSAEYIIKLMRGERVISNSAFLKGVPGTQTR
jgi:S1-C subfamily serine protease